MTIRTLVAMTLIAGSAAALLQSAPAAAADAKKGQQLFITYGCYGCHGYNGQGANVGPKLAPEPMSLDALTAYIRNSQTAMMPPYAAAILPDPAVADIHAWLASQPKAADWKTMPLLKD